MINADEIIDLKRNKTNTEFHDSWDFKVNGIVHRYVARKNTVIPDYTVIWGGDPWMRLLLIKHYIPMPEINREHHISNLFRLSILQ